MVVQALYQAAQQDAHIEMLGDHFCKDPLQSFLKEEGIVGDPDYFKDVLSVFEANIDLMDDKIKSFLTSPWQIERLEPILLAILRAESAELFKRVDVPTALIINEYVTLAHGFFHHKEPALVRAILEKMSHILRPAAEPMDRP